MVIFFNIDYFNRLRQPYVSCNFEEEIYSFLGKKS